LLLGGSELGLSGVFILCREGQTSNATFCFLELFCDCVTWLIVVHPIFSCPTTACPLPTPLPLLISADFVKELQLQSLKGSVSHPEPQNLANNVNKLYVFLHDDDIPGLSIALDPTFGSFILLEPV
jgi:hypothetical protein